MATSTNLKENTPADLAAKVETANNIMRIKAWGGSGGNSWNFNPNAQAIQISVTFGDVIDSLKLTSLRPNGSVESIINVGVNGGDSTGQVNINGISEYLKGIVGTYEMYNGGKTVIKSITFQTNMATYGPFGSTGGSPFQFVMEDGGKIVGFHGGAGLYVDSIGVYASHL